jgi:hypothetical protein
MFVSVPKKQYGGFLIQIEKIGEILEEGRKGWEDKWQGQKVILE